MAAFFNSHTCLDVAPVGNCGNDLPGYKGYFKKIAMFNKSVTPLVVAFLVIGIGIFVCRNYLQQHNIDWQVLSGSNLFIYVVTVVSMNMLSSGLSASNTQLFLRKAYGGIMLKLFACAGAAFVYILVAGQGLNKKALFISMGLYLVYTFIEMSVIMKQSQQKKNG